MNNPDLLYLLCSRMDNNTLGSLSRTSLWNKIKLFSIDQHWWYLRVEHLIGRELQPRISSDWKSVYSILEASIQSDSPFMAGYLHTHVYENKLVVEILLEAGYDPSLDCSYRAIERASVENCIDVVKLLLEDGRAELDLVGHEVICCVAANGEIELLKKLLLDERVNPSCGEYGALPYACAAGQLESIKLLLSDPRVHPSEGLFDAVKNGQQEALKLLLADSRADPSEEDNYIVSLAMQYQHLDILKLLLVDPRIDPTSGDNICRAYNDALKMEHFAVVDLLQADSRVVEAWMTYG